MKNLLVLTCLLLAPALSAQELTRFLVNAERSSTATPVRIPLDGLALNNKDGVPVLYEVTKEGEKYVPAQVESGYSFNLWFILPPSETPAGREFVLRLAEGPAGDQVVTRVSLEKNEKDLSLLLNNRPILSYRYATTSPPAGIDPLYSRSGYIHPLWSPGGFMLTRIQPSDHYHHYGIWGPWTKTHIDGREVDFWNLASGLGTVKFSKFISEVEGEVYSGFTALQQHIDFGGKGEDRVAMSEVLDVRVWNTGKNIWIIDYTTTINSTLENGILLDAYRYGGGIGFRATENWHKDNCSVLTSENKTREEADGTGARWCLIEGASDSGEGRSGILFLSHPSNRMHPEPMRVWPPDANGGRGDMFFDFTPIRHEEWKLEPHRSYALKYRMIVFDGKLDRESAEDYWKGFAHGPEVYMGSGK